MIMVLKHGKMVEPCREAKAAEAIGWAEKEKSRWKQNIRRRRAHNQR